MGKYYSVNPEICTQDELCAAIVECENKADFYHTEEQAVKIFLNSVYGATASAYYICNSIDIAESITLQGQDLIKYSVRVLNRYFNEDWPNDKEAHKSIATKMKDLYPEFNVGLFMEKAKAKPWFGETCQIYGDTDSAYVSLDFLVRQCHIKKEWATNFILIVNEVVLEDYLNKQFEKYAEEWNCPKNVEKFELEKIARAVIMLAKKKYVMDIAWTDDGTFHKPLHKLKYTGMELAQSSTPEFCRKEMKQFIDFILGEINEDRKIEFNTIVDKILDIKCRFALQSPEAVSKSFKISDYDKFIKNDKGAYVELFERESKDGTFSPILPPLHVRGAAIHNNMLYNEAKKYKSKYSFIKPGDRVRFYYSEDRDRYGGQATSESVFAFIPGSFPLEFAPKMNIDIQFSKTILDPLNRIIEAIGFTAVPDNLAFTNSLF